MTASINYGSLPKDLRRVGEDALGRGVLQSLFTYGHDYGIVVKISDSERIGFSLYHVVETTLSNGEKYRIGVIDAVCVATQFRGNGFGTQITMTTLSTLAQYNVNRIEILLKRPTEEDLDTMPGVPILGSDRLLRKLGFRKVQTYPQHFLKTSQEYGYDCGICGETPDNCNGVLYAINDRDHAIFLQG